MGTQVANVIECAYYLLRLSPSNSDSNLHFIFISVPDSVYVRAYLSSLHVEEEQGSDTHARENVLNKYNIVLSK